jgi:hypothetical protein
MRGHVTQIFRRVALLNFSLPSFSAKTSVYQPQGGNQGPVGISNINVYSPYRQNSLANHNAECHTRQSSLALSRSRLLSFSGLTGSAGMRQKNFQWSRQAYRRPAIPTLQGLQDGSSQSSTSPCASLSCASITLSSSIDGAQGLKTQHDP